MNLQLCLLQCDFSKYLTYKQKKILIERLKPYCDFEDIMKNGFPESIHTLIAYISNAERRFEEDKPKKWWVVVEFLIMGIIAGYYIPIWIAHQAYPHSRSAINESMGVFGDAKLD